MSNTEQIDHQLIDKTVTQRKEILNKANKKAKQIKKNAETEKKRINDQVNKSIEGIIGSEIRALHDRIVGGAQLQGRKLVMEARQKVLDGIAPKGQEIIKTIAAGNNPGINYTEILVKLIQESVVAISGDEFIVQANQNDLRYLQNNLSSISSSIGGKSIKIDDEPIDIIGGVIVSNPDGTKQMINTLENRLKTTINRMQADIAEKLGVI